MLKTLSLSVCAERFSYPIHIGEALLQDAVLLRSLIRSKQVMIVSNPTVAQWYLDPLRAIYADYQCDYHLVPDGEAYKTLEQWEHLLNALMDRHHHRDTTILALGGGVIGDMAGFAAACYQRGVDVVQIPTTVLAQVDSAIGGKTAVNHPAGKNCIGVFHQPRAVIIDLNTLRTLPEREYRAGLAEIIKVALICDAAFFSVLEHELPLFLERDLHTLQKVIARACEIKADIIVADEKETAQRALLNLGHTFAHAIEHTLGFGYWLHGEAVSVGLIAAARLSEQQGLLTAIDTARIRRLLLRAALPTTLPPDTDCAAVLSAMQMDKKILDQKLRFILLEGLGKANVHTQVKLSAVLSVLTELLA